jgi:hypothetical protein
VSAADGANEPGAQLEHVVACAALDTEPGAQASHVDLPRNWANEPAAHASHCVALSAF